MDSGYLSQDISDVVVRERPSIMHSMTWSEKEFREKVGRGGRRNTVHARGHSTVMMDEEDNGNDSVHSHGPTMKDQEHMVQDLKKENFDLKLRLYMEQKENESSSSKVEEYEQQIAQLLDKLEESSKLSKVLESELKNTRVREKTLVTKHKRLEEKCAEKDQHIHSLSMDLTKLQSLSMQDLSTMKHSTPLRHAQSEFRLTPHDELLSNDEDSDVTDDENEAFGTHDDSKPFSSVRPMQRKQSTDENDIEALLDGNEERRNSTGGITNVHNIEIHERNNSSRSYNNQYTPVRNFYKYEYSDGRPVAAAAPRTQGEAENVGVVRPNNSRIGVDANIETYIVDQRDGKKKKKKGLMRIFKMCGGGKSSKVQRNASVYTKSDVRARPIPEERPLDHRL